MYLAIAPFTIKCINALPHTYVWCIKDRSVHMLWFSVTCYWCLYCGSHLVHLIILYLATQNADNDETYDCLKFLLCLIVLGHILTLKK